MPTNMNFTLRSALQAELKPLTSSYIYALEYAGGHDHSSALSPPW